MSGKLFDFHAVPRITIGVIGEPGKRIFLLQAGRSPQAITLKLEKEQARTLALSLIEFLEELEAKHPIKDTKTQLPPKSDLALQTPHEPTFVVGQIGLGYDQERDKVVLVLQEVGVSEDQEASDLTTVRFWVTRAQMQSLSEHTLEIINQGRPSCYFCGSPLDPETLFCPRHNGHGNAGRAPCLNG
jgi:uncharacterized repeat protein (TIGR03847 family)